MSDPQIVLPNANFPYETGFYEDGQVPDPNERRVTNITGVLETRIDLLVTLEFAEE